MKFMIFSYCSWIFLVAVLIIGCDNNRPTVADTTQDLVKKTTSDELIVSGMGVVLSDKVKSVVANWRQYQSFDEAIKPYYATTVQKSLLNAQDLTKQSNALRNSKAPDLLDNKQVETRLNILYTEAKRLEDMASIKSVTSEEVTQQTKLILSVYDMFNSKLNDIYKVQKLEEDILTDPDLRSLYNHKPRIELSKLPSRK